MQRELFILFWSISLVLAAVPTPFPTHSLQPTSPTIPPTPLPTPNLRQDEAVTALYMATNGASWKCNTNWMNGDPCNNSWFGVICDKTSGRKLINLELGANSLAGSIPSEIGLLSTVLQNFNFQNNDLTGSLPSQVGSLSLCTSGFHFCGNSLSGSLPSEIGQLTAMEFGLSFCSNGFSNKLPSELGSLDSMEYGFFVYANSFTGTLPSEMGNLVNIRNSFRVDKNSLNGALPSELGLLASMTHSLYLSTNQFSGSVPSQLGLVRLEVEGLKLSSNSFCGDLPTNVSLLQPSILTSSGLGTPCCEHVFPSSVPLTNYSFTCAPTSVPTQPTPIPSPLPTVVPYSLPSQVPTSAPSTLSPTTLNTHIIEFYYKVLITSQYGEDYEPTVVLRASLRSASDDALGVGVNRFKVYSLAPTPVPSPTPSDSPTLAPSLHPLRRLRSRALLTSGVATWRVSFEMESTLNQAVSMIANTTAVLESPSYAVSIATVLNATSVSTLDIVSEVQTRAPTSVPSMVPTTWQPTPVPSNPPSPPPTRFPIAPTSLPTALPTLSPSPLPSLTPSFEPTAIPTMRPTSFVENALPFAGACIGGLLILSIVICYPLLRNSPPPMKILGPPRQQSVLDEECLEFLGKVFDEDYLPSIINRFELCSIPGASSTSSRSIPIDSSLEVDSLTLMMMRIKEQVEGGEVNVEDLPRWCFGDLLELKEDFLIEEPLDLNQNQVNRFKNKVKKFKTNKFGVVVKLPKSLKGMKKSEVEMVENSSLTKEELAEQHKIHQELQKQATIEAIQIAESKDDAYGFVVSKLKLKGARGRAVASKMKNLGFDSQASFSNFDETIMSDSVLKSDVGLVAVEVRRLREACLKEKELLSPSVETHGATNTPLLSKKQSIKPRDQSPRVDRSSALKKESTSAQKSPQKHREASPRKEISPRKDRSVTDRSSRTESPRKATSPRKEKPTTSLLKDKLDASPKKQGKGKGPVRAPSSKEKLNNRGGRNPLSTDTSVDGTTL